MPLAFLFQDYLRQNAVGQIRPGLGINDLKFAFGANHLSQIVQRNVSAGLGIVESAVGVLFYSYDIAVCSAGRFVAGGQGTRAVLKLRLKI